MSLFEVMGVIRHTLLLRHPTVVPNHHETPDCGAQSSSETQLWHPVIFRYPVVYSVYIYGTWLPVVHPGQRCVCYISVLSVLYPQNVKRSNNQF
ncbi:hypothetical protein CDAR_524271 [Caerostris darwini]|uniref:Uncharacterized protein n=1 Tax=Caerostris darwini TaxID=1538125 RepID=A0AAV4RFP7_9ARAC|nr:hypothetical protein CDAR_524271 [Caerostris darwini]